MGTIIEFPASRRLGSTTEFAPLETAGTVVILPVRIASWIWAIVASYGLNPIEAGWVVPVR